MNHYYYHIITLPVIIYIHSITLLSLLWFDCKFYRYNSIKFICICTCITSFRFYKYSLLPTGLVCDARPSSFVLEVRYPCFGTRLVNENKEKTCLIVMKFVHSRFFCSYRTENVRTASCMHFIFCLFVHRSYMQVSKTKY